VTLARQAGTAFEPESMRGKVKEASQDTLRLPSRPVYRFLMQTSFLRTGTKRFAILLGSERVSEMRTLEAKLAADPSAPCGALTSGTRRAVCVSFEGDVTVSPEVAVTVNGAPRYVPWGATLGNLLREVKSASHVRLRRMWEGQLRRVDVEDQAALARTVLTGGDEIVWDAVP
jgi:hypothetical protein